MNRSLLSIVGSLFFALLMTHSTVYGQGSDNVTLLASIDPRPSTGYNDCWGYTATDGREYALIGAYTGTSIIDITDTDNVSEVDFISGSFSIWRDIKTYQNYAYVVNESGGGMQIIDLSDLPSSASVAATFGGFSVMHNIYIDEDNAMLYASPGSGSAACIAYSLADPTNPVQTSTFGIHNHDSYARNGIVYLSEGGNGSIGVFDLTDPSSPTFLQRFDIPASGYVHNAWTTEDGNYLMTTEETSGKTIKFWDISDLDNVTLKSEVLGSGGLAHNAHIKGDYAYVSHYSDGLKIYDLSDPDNVAEIGFYDTHAATVGGSGAWGAFPFFDSGKILISDQEHGLFVVTLDSPTGIDDTPDVAGVPGGYQLGDNYPNPFNPSTQFRFTLPQPENVRISVYNLQGQTVATLVNERKAAGDHTVQFDARDLPSGLYLYQIEAGQFQAVKKMILTK